MNAVKLPLCGQCEDGWVIDPDTLLPVRRCPCRLVEADPGKARDEAMGATAAAHGDAMRAALRIIRDTARRLPVLSANDCRTEMRLAQVPGEVVGAAFRQAAKDRAIRKIGYVASTDAATHAHPVAEYSSLIYRGTTARVGG